MYGGQASSSGFVLNVPLNAIELKCCTQIDNRWDRKAVSRLSPIIITATLDYSFVISRLDYCSSLYAARLSFLDDILRSAALLATYLNFTTSLAICTMSCTCFPLGSEPNT